MATSSKSQCGDNTGYVTSLILQKLQKAWRTKNKQEHKETKNQLDNRHTEQTVTRHQD